MKGTSPSTDPGLMSACHRAACRAWRRGRAAAHRM